MSDDYLLEPQPPRPPLEVEIAGSEEDGWAYARGFQEPTWETRQGKWQFFFEDGVLSHEESYVNGIRQGLYRGWWNDGTERRTGELRDGSYYGRWWFRDRDGAWHWADMVNGQVHGIVHYFGPNNVHFGTAEWQHGRRLWQDLRRHGGEAWDHVEFEEDGDTPTLERQISPPKPMIPPERPSFE